MTGRAQRHGAGVTLRARASTFVGSALLAPAVVLLADAALRGRWDGLVDYGANQFQ
jgi:hypothetical protein